MDGAVATGRDRGALNLGTPNFLPPLYPTPGVRTTVGTRIKGDPSPVANWALSAKQRPRLVYDPRHACPFPALEAETAVAKVKHFGKLCDALETTLRRSEDRAAKLVEAVVQEMVA